mmetsp:Transcript_98825/g.195963  ORF Transcript_98825/g.195963 Transcript_98825/m.195963 type:complete len:203 (-) Transcript_98825:614-1222(-)
MEFNRGSEILRGRRCITTRITINREGALLDVFSSRSNLSVLRNVSVTLLDPVARGIMTKLRSFRGSVNSLPAAATLTGTQKFKCRAPLVSPHRSSAEAKQAATTALTVVFFTRAISLMRCSCNSELSAARLTPARRGGLRGPVSECSSSCSTACKGAQSKCDAPCKQLPVLRWPTGTGFAAMPSPSIICKRILTSAKPSPML